MTRERAKWMDQASFLDIGHGGSDGETMSAAHGFLGIRQTASVHTVPGGVWGMSVQVHRYAFISPRSDRSCNPRWHR